jgi:hypothetical protein
MNTLACGNEARRTAVRNSPKLAGFDYIEFDAPTKTLNVYFLGELPSTPLTPENFQIQGGRRVRDIKVVSVFAHPRHDPELDDFVEVVVDCIGDFSTYTLLAVAKTSPSLGNPVWIPHPDFGPQYNQLDFSFTVDCPNTIDCAQDDVCPPPVRPQVAINYLAKDYATFRQLIFDRLAVTLPDWKNRFVPDVGVTLVELLAYAGDYLSYYQDAVATEAYLATARQRISVRRHARLVDYILHEGCNARALLVVGTTDEQSIEPGKVRFVTSPDVNLPVELTNASVAKFNAATYSVFEAVATTQLHAGHENIDIYTWGDSECCLPRGATATTLVDQNLQLKIGDYLIFEEVLGSKTGLAADADPSHRWAVQLTSVTADTDPLNGTKIRHIEWSQDDALPFPLCLSSIGPAPACALLTNVSVARGNVVLVDHGRSVTEVLPAVQEAISTPTCDGQNMPSDVTHRPQPFRPSLSQPGLTYRQALPATTPASNLFTQDPHSAVPIVNLSGTWTPAPDLMEKRATDRNFVVEIDNRRVAWLRFGDGCHGAQPTPGVAFQAAYRVGNGQAGNVGAESIQHVLWDTQVTGLIVSVRNPLAARGGVDPQPIAEAKLFAPHTFRTQIERAITADDYAVIAQREFPLEVQRAACQLRWNGSWYEALVAIDAFGTEQASADLLHRVEHRLRWFRRLGHDLRVEAAVRVPIYISLTVCVKSVYLRAHVLADLEARFGTGTLPDGSLAFFHPDNLTFGEGLYLSQIVSLAQSVPGVESVQVQRFEREFDPASSGIASGVLSFGPFEIAECDSDPSFPENGRIEFLMGGRR